MQAERSHIYVSPPKLVEPMRHRIKISFVIDLIETCTAGTESHLRSLIETLDRDEFDVEIICLLPNPRTVADSFPCHVHSVCTDNQPGNPVSRFLKLVSHLRRRRPHIVQTYFQEGNTLGLLAAGVARTPIIIGTTRNSSLPGEIHHRILRQVSGILADKWQCNSKAVWDREKNRLGMARSKLVILPNALDLTKFSPPDEERREQVRRSLGLDTRQPIIVSVANPRPVKDVSTLIRAARHVKEQYPLVQFVVVGTGPMLETLQQEVCSAGLGDQVRFAGAQSDVTPFIAAADICVLTSLSEGSSNSVLEYMGMGIPSVLSDIPPNRELVSGLFFEPGNEKDLARKIQTLLTDASLRAQLRHEYVSAAEEHSSQKVFALVRGYYSKLADEIRRNSGDKAFRTAVG